MLDFLTSLEKTLPILMMIFATVFLLILLTRLILTFLINQAYKNYKKLKKISKKKFFPKRKKFIKEDEELLKKLEIPRSQSQMKAEARLKQSQQQSGSYELMISEEQEKDRQELNQVNIVDIVKPIGFFTAMILGQKLTYLIQSAQTINNRGHKGFWVSMIEAKDRAAGRQHGRGR
jgi:cell division protein YceG involved in septum cleavage